MLLTEKPFFRLIRIILFDQSQMKKIHWECDKQLRWCQKWNEMSTHFSLRRWTENAPRSLETPKSCSRPAIVTSTTSSTGVKILSLVKFHTRSDNRSNTIITLGKLNSFLNLKVKCWDLRIFGVNFKMFTILLVQNFWPIAKVNWSFTSWLVRQQAFKRAHTKEEKAFVR